MTDIYAVQKLMRCNRGPLMQCWIIQMQLGEDAMGFWKLDVIKTRREIAETVGLETRVLTKQLRDEYHCFTSEFPGCYAFLDRDRCEVAVEYLKTLLVANVLRKEY